ncbi:hypothetical protein SD77_2492 [Bacillus badius]|uniref:Uncharacterized protein n=1 Tax=Bacillus badius TaxID=1455 RepID=A0ABR5AZ76_BACBA|nr:hypothetical protein SD78_2049 [Bacillus badius]KIL80038.1 hypothetical protein SD77_2492 [Bacillus badius]
MVIFFISICICEILFTIDKIRKNRYIELLSTIVSFARF